MTCECTERQAIVDVLNAYATCLDARDWSGLNDVFHPDAVGIYAATLTGRAAIIESIRSFLDGCGPSQHLLGNYRIAIDGDEAQSVTKTRVLHVGAGERANLTPYEAIGIYRDRHVRTAGGWRIIHRHFDVQVTLGDMDVLHPA